MNKFARKQPQKLGALQKLPAAVQFHNTGKLAEAKAIYKEILASNPRQHDALHLLGVLAFQQENSVEAVKFISKAVKIRPDYAAAHNNLGNVFRSLHRQMDALKSYKKAIAADPKQVDAHHNLGIVMQQLGRLDEAEASFYRAIVLKPDHGDAYNNLGNVQVLKNRPTEAFESFRRAVAYNPENEQFWGDLASVSVFLSFNSADESLMRDLLVLLDLPAVRPIVIQLPILSAIRHHQDFAALLKITTSTAPTENSVNYCDAARQLSAIPLLLRLMSLCSIGDLEIEKMLTFLRHQMLKETIAGNTDETGLPFSIAQALQGFTNEYAFFETKEETSLVTELEQKILKLKKEQQDVPPNFLAALGAYRPLYHYSWAHSLNENIWTGEMEELIRRQISEPLEEQNLRSQIPCLTPIENSISQSVREQYEENPFPRWIKTGVSNAGETIGSALNNRFGIDLADYTSPERPEILIAGCGTGQQPIGAASTYSNADILAVDLSLSSLAYACRKSKELGISNIVYAQADIMELEKIDRQFDLIESTGVLHHLGDPLAGWQVLANLLRSGGLMRIALYSEIARREIVKGHSFIADGGYGSTAQNIRQCRQDIIKEAENGNSEMAHICRLADFFSLSTCRDLLFHVQEHRFTLPQIEKALESLNLNFVALEVTNNNYARKFTEFRSGDKTPGTLSQWNEFELDNPHTFAGMYTIWCQKT